MTDSNDNLDYDAYKAEIESPEFKHGFDVGVSFGLYEAQEEALAAYNAGEIDLWISLVTPKSAEEWDEWEADHGSLVSFRKRWVDKDNNDT